MNLGNEPKKLVAVAQMSADRWWSRELMRRIEVEEEKVKLTYGSLRFKGRDMEEAGA